MVCSFNIWSVRRRYWSVSLLQYPSPLHQTDPHLFNNALLTQYWHSSFSLKFSVLLYTQGFWRRILILHCSYIQDLLWFTSSSLPATFIPPASFIPVFTELSNYTAILHSVPLAFSIFTFFIPIFFKQFGWRSHIFYLRIVSCTLFWLGTEFHFACGWFNKWHLVYWLK